MGLTEKFKELKEGDKVMLLSSSQFKLPPQFRNRTAVVERKIGRAYVVKFLNGKKVKRLTLKPEYLKKLKTEKMEK